MGGATGCPEWRAILVQVGRWEQGLSGHQHGVDGILLPTVDVGVLSTRLSHSPGTNG